MAIRAAPRAIPRSMESGQGELASRTVPSSSPDGNTPIIELRNITKSFGLYRAVDDVSIEIMPGQFLTLLGASDAPSPSTRGAFDARDGTACRGGPERRRTP